MVLLRGHLPCTLASGYLAPIAVSAARVSAETVAAHRVQSGLYAFGTLRVVHHLVRYVQNSRNSLLVEGVVIGGHLIVFLMKIYGPVAFLAVVKVGSGLYFVGLSVGLLLLWTFLRILKCPLLL
jgi:hypothetical protein